MDVNEELDIIFEQFISNTVSYARLKLIKNSVTLSNIDILMRKIESLDDPSAYCKNDFDSKTPDVFFQFIDFVSALIINLGSPAIGKVKKFGNTNNPFLPWVIKYVDDDRFHHEIIEKFGSLFTE